MHLNSGGPWTAMIVHGRHWNHGTALWHQSCVLIDRTPRITWLFRNAFLEDKNKHFLINEKNCYMIFIETHLKP